MSVNKQHHEEFLKISQKNIRGKLKVYIGSIAGVGKTYRMLQEAHYLQSKRVDIVIGYVETHERKETAELLKGLKVIPRVQIPYKDVTIEEMDLNKILKLKPSVVIVDELAHTNAPFCRNHKRYQDIEEILNHGINVICAFNIQHLESLNDVIKKFSDITIYETVPDSFLKSADQVVNIDLSAEDILDRLNSGKIYQQNKIEQALKNFFKTDNIVKLREIALREVAEAVNQKSTIDFTKDSLAKQLPSDKLLFYIIPQKYSQKQIIRKVSRLSGKLNPNWHIVYIGNVNKNPSIQNTLFDDIKFAEELGAKFIHIKEDKNKGDFLLKFAKKEGINHIALNAHNENWLSTILGFSNLYKILKSKNIFDVYLINSNINEADQ